MNTNMQNLLVALMEEGVKNGCFPGGVALSTMVLYSCLSG